MSGLFSLENKVALIMGGAGGIGAGLVKGFSQQGAKVVISDFNQQAQDETAKRVSAETGNPVIGISCDVTKEETVAAMVKQVVDKMGTIDILVNAFGWNIKRDAYEYPMDDWRRLMDINITGVMIVCKQVGAQVFKAKKAGKIINLSSVRGIRGKDGGNVGYSATKGAVEMITKSLALEWAPYNINVNAIGPALVITQGTIHIKNDPALAEKYRKAIPLGRLPMPEDMVGPCVFLASPAADFITGLTIYVDGGVTAG
jgi:NAD(P)-dependent dehydrogenase (short-subunit alcohol dehydrogenase family)